MSRLVTVIIVILVIAAIVGGDDDDSSDVSPTGSEPASEEQQHPDTVLAQVMAQNFVEDALKAPSTAEFEWPEVRYSASRNLYSVIGQVDAQNSFGAQIRSEYVVIFRPVCDSVYSRGCWEVYSLGVGDRVYIDREVPGSGDQGAVTHTSTDEEGGSSNDDEPVLPNSQTEVDVLRLQRQLEAAGYDPGPVDGMLGPKTREAIREFQRDRDLDVTGEPTSRLLGRIESAAEMSGDP